MCRTRLLLLRLYTNRTWFDGNCIIILYDNVCVCVWGDQEIKSITVQLVRGAVGKSPKSIKGRIGVFGAAHSGRGGSAEMCVGIEWQSNGQPS